VGQGGLPAKRTGGGNSGMEEKSDTLPVCPLHFLIIGAGRGGTSLLAGLLDYHSKLEVGFEMFSTKYLMGRSLFHTLVHSKKKLIYHRTTAFRKACIHESKKFPGKLWGNKITTEQIYGLEDHNLANPDQKVDIIDFFFRNSMPDIRIVFILRDGRTCVRSKVNRTGQSVEIACLRWKFSVQVYRYLREFHNNNITVKFEDLLNNPRFVLEDICTFLGVSFEEKMLMGTTNKKMLPEYRSDTFNQPKQTLEDIPEKYCSMIQDELRYCGYLISE
jgi:hypothetical protein